jgi:hypothetical protein
MWARKVLLDEQTYLHEMTRFHKMPRKRIMTLCVRFQVTCMAAVGGDLVVAQVCLLKCLCQPVLNIRAIGNDLNA